ncbi:adhesion G-protein coupled receptor G6-like [Pecten maximus]|uniref:adhesion G-protein coupled receptor G6-like n=1 Tax=Pecten maximus TaxID=6579 RepID=UPI001458D0C3|nr:adhesion G-protein coupled receptor G6-like [Pecten maximus]
MSASTILWMLMGGLLGLTCYEGKQLIATDYSQTIETPGYSSGYSYLSNTFQTWTIETQDAQNIVKVEIDMDIEFRYSYCRDSLQIYDGTSIAATSLGKFCGKSTDNLVTSSDRNMYLVFMSDNNDDNNKGFKLTYIQVSVPEEVDAIDAWKIVGIVFAVVIGIGIACVTVFCYCKHKSKDRVTPCRINGPDQNQQNVWMTPVPQRPVQAVPAQILPNQAYQQVPHQYPQTSEMQNMYSGNIPGAANFAVAEPRALQQQFYVKS